MIWTIAKKEFLLNLISARFTIGLLLCLAIIPFTVVVSVDNYLNKLQVYKTEKERADRAYKEVCVWSWLRPTVVKEPEVLSIFSSGISDNLGNESKIYFSEYPLFPSGHVMTRDNPLLNAFFSIDFAKVIGILISLIALVFSYDALTREREEGTMKLSLTGKVSRISFLFGKITGLLITLIPILLLCYLLACLMVLLNPQVALSTSDWGGIVLLFLTSMIYLLVYILIGIVISGLVTRSSSAIIWSLLCWIWFLFLLPNISTYLSQSIVKTPLYENVQNVINEYNKEEANDYQEVRKQIQNDLNLYSLSYYNYNRDRDGAVEMSGLTKEMALYHQRLAIWQFPFMLNSADKKWAVQRRYFDELIDQQKWQQRIAWLSPSEIFAQATNILCRTDMHSFLQYMERVRHYRETFIRHYTDKKLFESTAYFTAEPFETLFSIEDIESMGEDRYWEIMDEKEFFFPYLNTEDVPRFVSQPVTLSTVLDGVMGRLATLTGLMVILLLTAIAAFMRYDVR